MDTQISCYRVLGQTTNDCYIRFELTIVQDDSCRDKSSRHAYITKNHVYIFVRYFQQA